MASIASWQPRPGPKPVRPRLEPRLPLGFQRVDDPRLMHAVDDHGNPERALLSVRLRDVHPLDRPGLPRLRRRAAPSRPAAALARAVSTTLPSTPAVLRPALSSVTRRTLTACSRGTGASTSADCGPCLRSPACDAVKIRCRRRRTSSSTRRQSIGVPVEERRPPVRSPRRPAAVAASNLSFGSGVIVIVLSHRLT